VQGLDLHVAAAHEMLSRFRFAPDARLDDLMMSWASDGGGVGPHLDSYDVFLLQASGRRRWRIGAQRDLAVIEDAPLRILREFRPSREWVLEPGDMLYLPPHYAHDGVAMGECMTYSIGFRAPSVQELAARFLAHLEERIDLPGRYCDPDLKRQAHPAEISPAMLRQASALLRRIRWSGSDVREFLGCYLSEPKPHVFFSAPARPLGAASFARRCAGAGVRLDPKTQLLFAGSTFYLNGEPVTIDAAARPSLRRLADRRRLNAATALSAGALDLLYDWYRHGLLRIGAQTR
jgi:50S ribosomal protein L16 3-hydroxylase